MGTVYNIRGTNGSGKSTLARAFTGPPTFDVLSGRPVELNSYEAPTHRDPKRRKRAEGFIVEHDRIGCIGIVGSYVTACGGMDAMPNFEVCQTAIGYLLEFENCRHVIAEGILASTVYGSWGKFASDLSSLGHAMTFCYLDTPLEVCLERIKARQRAAGKEREIKEQLVRDKFTAIRSTRDKVLSAGHVVYDIPYQRAQEALYEIMAGEGSSYRG